MCVCVCAQQSRIFFPRVVYESRAYKSSRGARWFKNSRIVCVIQGASAATDFSTTRSPRVQHSSVCYRAHEIRLHVRIFRLALIFSYISHIDFSPLRYFARARKTRYLRWFSASGGSKAEPTGKKVVLRLVGCLNSFRESDRSSTFRCRGFSHCREKPGGDFGKTFREASGRVKVTQLRRAPTDNEAPFTGCFMGREEFLLQPLNGGNRGVTTQADEIIRTKKGS